MSSEKVSSFPNLSEYLKKNKIQVKLSIYYSGMSSFVVNMYRVLPFSMEPDDKKRGELLADARGETIEECFASLDIICEAWLEAEKKLGEKPWQKSIPKSTDNPTQS